LIIRREMSDPSMAYSTVADTANPRDEEALLGNSASDRSIHRRFRPALAIGAVLAFVAVCSWLPSHELLHSGESWSPESKASFEEVCEHLEVDNSSCYNHGVAAHGIETLEACCQKCHAVPSCVSFTYFHHTDGASCVLRNGLKCEAKAVDGAISGIVEERENEVENSPYPLNWQTLHEEPLPYNCEAGTFPNLWPPDGPAGPGPTKSSVGLLTFNLEWWHTFNQAAGPKNYKDLDSNNMTKFISGLATAQNLELMVFQECDDVEYVLHASPPLRGLYRGLQSDKSTGIAFKMASFDLLDHGYTLVAEDAEREYWGQRTLQWARLKHIVSDKIVFLANHHGPLPVNSGGICGGEITALNILRVIQTHGKSGDIIALAGDFNDCPGSATIEHLKRRLNHVFNGVVDGGVDNVFVNIDKYFVLNRTNLGNGFGNGASDHSALSMFFEL